MSRILACVLFLVEFVAAGRAGAAPATIEIERPAKARTVRVVGLDEANLKALAAARWDAARWLALFAVYLERDRPTTGEQPAILGSHYVRDGVLHFEPRFSFAPGNRYRAVFDPARLPRPLKQVPLSLRFADARVKKPPTVVSQVYPTADKLPENQLKFYIHFSAPMVRGDVYKHLHLLGPEGKAIRFPFLELGEELWNPDGTRLTLFFDPGRIKRGLKPREEAGPALQEGKKYTLVIDSSWKDADDEPLKAAYRKPFTVGAADASCPDPKKWRLEVPAANTAKALGVRFRKPLDHALLQRMLWVSDAHGRKVTGVVAVSDGETRWQFTPRVPWQAATYYLKADTRLEDLAGNSIGRPFEVDVVRPVKAEIKQKTVRLPFTVAAARR